MEMRKSWDDLHLFRMAPEHCYCTFACLFLPYDELTILLLYISKNLKIFVILVKHKNRLQ